MGPKLGEMGWGFGGFYWSFWILDVSGPFRSPLMVFPGELLG